MRIQQGPGQALWGRAAPFSDVVSMTQCRPPSGLDWGSNGGATHISEQAPFTVGDGGATGTKK